MQARLLRVFHDTAGERHARREQEGVLAVLRSDYMLHAPTNSLLQARGGAGVRHGGSCQAAACIGTAGSAIAAPCDRGTGVK